jgi:hypothetical protein
MDGSNIVLSGRHFSLLVRHRSFPQLVQCNQHYGETRVWANNGAAVTDPSVGMRQA